MKKKYEGLWFVAVEMPQSTVHSVHQAPDTDEHCWQVSPSPDIDDGLCIKASCSCAKNVLSFQHFEALCVM